MPKPYFEIGTDAYHTISQSCLSLTAYREGVYYPCGTAVMIAQFLAMTATHTLLDVMKLYMDKTYHQKDTKPKAILSTFTIMGVHHMSGAEYEARNLYFFHEKSDIAIIHFSAHNTLAQSFKIKIPLLDFNIPKKGEQIHAFGYIEPPTEKEKNLPNRIVYGNGDVLIGAYTKGLIVEVHEEFRDTARMNFPCFQSNARFDANMSGGPIFNKYGNLIGIISSDLPPVTEEEDHASYGAILYACLLTPMSASLKGLEGLDYYPAMALAEEKIIHARGWEIISWSTTNRQSSMNPSCFILKIKQFSFKISKSS